MHVWHSFASRNASICLQKPSLARCASSTPSERAAFFPSTKTTALPKGTFDGKVVFVTGGGTGLGRGMVTKFSEMGATVVIAAR